MQEKTNSLFLVTAVMLFSIMLVVGCSVTRSPGFEEAEDVPIWVINPPQAEDVSYGIGIAQKANPALGQQAADSRARDAIVRNIKLEIGNLLRDSMGEVLTTLGPEGRDYTESVSEQVGAMTLSGSVIEKREVHGKTWYSLAKVNIAVMRTNILEAAREEARRDEAMYQKFQAEQSFDRLQKKVEQLQGSTNKVDE